MWSRERGLRTLLLLVPRLPRTRPVFFGNIVAFTRSLRRRDERKPYQVIFGWEFTTHHGVTWMNSPKGGCFSCWSHSLLDGRSNGQLVHGRLAVMPNRR